MDLFNLLIQYGPVPASGFLFLALLWYFRKWINRGLLKFLSTHRRNYPLAYHTFFLRMQTWMKYDVRHIDFLDDFRKEVFTDFLLIKMGTAVTQLKQLVDDDRKWEKLHQNELKDLLISTIIEVVTTYEEKCRAEGIPEAVIKKFNHWHEPRVKFTIDGIKSVCSSQFYRNNRSRLAACLDICTVTFHDTVLDAERTLTSLNGELKNLTYKGFTCKH